MASDVRPPRSVRLIWRVRDALVRRPVRWISLALLPALAIWGIQGLYTVDNGESAALLLFRRAARRRDHPGTPFSPGLGRR